MVINKTEHSGKEPAKQGLGEGTGEPNKIGASTPYDFEGKNLTAYGGLLPVATMLERHTILSWDDDYRALPAQVAKRNQRWRRAHDLPDVCLDGRAD